MRHATVCSSLFSFAYSGIIVFPKVKREVQTRFERPIQWPALDFAKPYVLERGWLSSVRCATEDSPTLSSLTSYKLFLAYLL